MRQRTRSNVIQLFKNAGAEPELDPEPQELDEPTAREIARAFFVENFGPRTAGWLIFKHRRQLHMRGVFDFKVPDRPTKEQAEKLRWFFTAMDFLKKRPGWTVDVITHRNVRSFRVRWLNWPHWGVQREIVSSS